MYIKKYGTNKNIAKFHLPGLFEFYELYRVFLEIYFDKRIYFYDWVEIDSLYGAPYDCIWGGGRVGFGEDDINDFLNMLRKYNISARLTFSNSLIKEEHLSDKKCNDLCRLINNSDNKDKLANEGLVKNGVIIYSEMLLDYLRKKYKNLYFVSSTTKVITDFDLFKNELNREEFSYVVPDFRLNKKFDKLMELSDCEKEKVEFLCNECCFIGCNERKACYENVSRKSLGEECLEHICISPNKNQGYKFSNAMKNPSFIGINDIKNIYLPMGFENFKIEGRGLGSALILEFLLYYLVKPEFQINVREEIYLDSNLDLF